ncbi:hypothetical protein MHU86_3015 [Fragilaria crotonensis]|nr:hypothetical protein MHU86_3015 [Fragilaria crotonensis]
MLLLTCPRTHHVSVVLLENQSLLKSYSDQTGRFHVPSSRGNNYIFVLYHQDTNSIHAVAIPNRQAASIRNAWETTHKLLLRQGHPPDLHILDNECSQDLKDAFTKYKIQFQRVPPKEHRANAAERAIRTFKNHFVSVLCTVHSKFPLTEWDRLLPQTTLTLNLLRSSRIHPSLSAHASLFGNYDFNRTPLAPMGTQIVAHTSADTRTPFGEHGKVGWYIGPSLEHYRCWKCYFQDTMHERDVLKVDFFPEKIAFPEFSREDYLRQTAEDMLHLLHPQHPTAFPLHDPLSFGPPILNAYAKVADILRRAVHPLSSAPIAPVPPPTLAPVAPPRVPSEIADPPPALLASPRSVLPLAPVSLPRVLVSASSKPLPLPAAVLRQSPRARLTRLMFDPRTHRRLPLAQSIQHDPTIAGKILPQASPKPSTLSSADLIP